MCKLSVEVSQLHSFDDFICYSQNFSYFLYDKSKCHKCTFSAHTCLLCSVFQTKCILLLPKPVFPLSLNITVITQAPNQHIIINFSLTPPSVFILSCWLSPYWSADTASWGSSSLHLPSYLSCLVRTFLCTVGGRMCVRLF